MKREEFSVFVNLTVSLNELLDIKVGEIGTEERKSFDSFVEMELKRRKK